MKRTMHTLGALLAISLSPSLQAEQTYLIKLSLHELAPWYAFWESDTQFTNLVFVTTSGTPVPIKYQTDMTYPVLIEKAFPADVSESNITFEPISAGLDGIIEAAPAVGGAGNVMMSMTFSYTHETQNTGPFIETASAHQSMRWISKQGETASFPFNVGDKKYRMELTATSKGLPSASIFPKATVDGEATIVAPIDSPFLLGVGDEPVAKPNCGAAGAPRIQVDPTPEWAAALPSGTTGAQLRAIDKGTSWSISSHRNPSGSSDWVTANKQGVVVTLTCSTPA